MRLFFKNQSTITDTETDNGRGSVNLRHFDKQKADWSSDYTRNRLLKRYFNLVQQFDLGDPVLALNSYNTFLSNANWKMLCWLRGF